MSNISVFLDKAKSDYAAARTILDEYKDTPLPLEKKTEVTRLLDAVEEFKNRADTEKRTEDLDKFLNDPTNRLPVEGKTEAEKTNMKVYENAFSKALRETKSHNPREHMTAVETKALSSVSAIDGGYMASEDFRNQLIVKQRDRTFIRANATVISTDKGVVGFPTFDYDGDAPLVAEGGAFTVQDIRKILGKETFTPVKRGLIFKVPMELVEDSDMDLINLLTTHFSTRFSELEEIDFLLGDGANKPFGLLCAPFQANTVASGGTITPENVIELPYKVRSVYRGKGMYMMHRNVIKAVRLMRDGSGGAGTGQFLWQPSFVAGQPPTVNGFAVGESEYFTDYSASGGAGKPLMLFGDLSQYWIIDRKSYSVQVLSEKYAENDQIGYKLRKRYDAAPIMFEAFARLNRQA